MPWPELLYHYYPWGASARAAIERDLIYFSCPVDWNDPFECRFRVDASSCSEELARGVTKGKHSMAEVVAGLEETEEHLRRNTAAFSLSKTRDSLRMWSHYADKHRGICVGFNFRGGKAGLVPFEVKYTDRFATVDVTSFLELAAIWANIADDGTFTIKETHEMLEKATQAMYCTKALGWKDEGEYRILAAEGPRGFRELPTNTISEVYLGCEATRETRQEVLGILGRRGAPHPTVWQLRLKRDAYGLLPERIPLKDAEGQQ
ncbi:MAG: DUF2971 domain-containing protein [Planctomycetota bacterium]|jgi:hypothetical protein